MAELFPSTEENAEPNLKLNPAQNEAVTHGNGPLLVVAGKAICGLSGGVDSAVAAALVHKAIGDQLTCVFVDTGLMRTEEAQQVVDTFESSQGIELIHIQAAERFFEQLKGVQADF